MILIFGTEESPDEHIIPDRHLEKIPSYAQTGLLSGQTITLDGVRIHRLGPSRFYEYLLRLKQFLDHNDYYPFDPKAELQVVAPSGDTTTWPGSPPAPDKPHKPHQRDGLHTTDATHELFRTEVELYIFAATIGYQDLLRFSYNKICTAYPVLAREALFLLERLYRIALRLDDKPLMTFIESSAKENCQGLIKQPGFTSLLRQAVQQDRLSQVVLESHIGATQAMQADLRLAKMPMNSPPVVSVPSTFGSRHAELASVAVCVRCGRSLPAGS